MGKQKKKKAKKPGVLTMPGLDYGIVRSVAVLTAPDFNDNMRAAEIIACAYGEMGAPGIDAVIPFLSVVAKKPELLKKAFSQFKAWMEATGPDALTVEILYSGAGYYISFGPQHQYAMWRTVGVDQLFDPMFFGVTYIKKIDTRQRFVDQLALYSKHAVAPVMLMGAHYIGKLASGPAPRPSEIAQIKDCPNLLLWHLPIYKTKEEVPRLSTLRSIEGGSTKAEFAESREKFEEQAIGPNSVTVTRERRLNALMPITLHMLRTYGPLQEKIASLTSEGLERWQIEQAIVNQRLWSLTSSSQRARFQNANDLHKALESFMELDSPDWNVIADDREAILRQVLRDARMLLKKIGAKAPESLQACQAELGARSYLTKARNAS